MPPVNREKAYSCWSRLMVVRGRSYRPSSPTCACLHGHRTCLRVHQHKPYGVFRSFMMEVIKFGKFAALVVAFGLVVGCSSKGGDASGTGAGTGASDPNAGYTSTSPSSMDDGVSSEEAALRAI